MFFFGRPITCFSANAILKGHRSRSQLRDFAEQAINRDQADALDSLFDKRCVETCQLPMSQTFHWISDCFRSWPRCEQFSGSRPGASCISEKKGCRCFHSISSNTGHLRVRVACGRRRPLEGLQMTISCCKFVKAAVDALQKDRRLSSVHQSVPKSWQEMAI